MSVHSTAPEAPGAHPAGSPAEKGPADVAYRRAWWLLALYPVTFAAAFVIGEGLISLFTDDVRDPVFWEVLVAATPALLVFVIPGVLAVMQGRKAMRLGRKDGMVPAIVGATIGIGFIGLNILSYVLQRVFG